MLIVAQKTTTLFRIIGAGISIEYEAL